MGQDLTDTRLRMAIANRLLYDAHAGPDRTGTGSQRLEATGAAYRKRL